MSIFWKLLLAICSISLIAPNALARMNVDEESLGAIESVALVGYSFFRNVEFEPASPFKLKPDVIELTPQDPEYRMMQEAAGRVIKTLQATKSFEVIEQDTVFANESYRSLSKDPEKRLAMNWYFPGEFRDLKNNKDNAVALAKALNVDAVLWIHFKHAGSSTSTQTLGVFGKKKEHVRLKGEVTLFDGAGNKLISGSSKSDKMVKSKRRSIGAVGEMSSGIEIETKKEITQADDLWFPLLESYLESLSQDLAK